VPEESARIHVIPGSPPDVIRSLADRIAADVIVLGPHRTPGRDETDQQLGGTAQAVVERTFAPCLVTPRPLRLPLERVLVPIDLSETARGALLVALSWASALRTDARGGSQTSLMALYVDIPAKEPARPDPAAALQRELDTVNRGAGDWARVIVEGRTAEHTDAAAAIASYAADRRADLVILGTRGLGVDDVARLGSVSARLTCRLKLPMLLVPPGVWRAHAAVP
jgi:nucleotide-binding universal stress UspA family protein